MRLIKESNSRGALCGAASVSPHNGVMSPHSQEAGFRRTINDAHWQTAGEKALLALIRDFARSARQQTKLQSGSAQSSTVQ
jgi:hypothetical protein